MSTEKLGGAARDVVRDLREVFDSFRAAGFRDDAVSVLVEEVYLVLDTALREGRAVPDTARVAHDYAREERIRGMALEMYAFIRRVRDAEYVPIKARMEAKQLADKVEGRGY